MWSGNTGSRAGNYICQCDCRNWTFRDQITRQRESHWFVSGDLGEGAERQIQLHYLLGLYYTSLTVCTWKQEIININVDYNIHRSHNIMLDRL